MSLVVFAVLLIVLVPAAFAGGLVIGRHTRSPAAAPPPEPPAESSVPSTLAGLLGRTGTELAQIAVRTGVDLGNRAIRDSLGSLSTWAQKERPDLRQATGADGFVTLMFTDIEGSTVLNERLGDDAWLNVLNGHDQLLRRCVRSAAGQVVKTQGDSFMVAFAQADAAVSCAVAIQRGIAEHRPGDGVELRVRIGIHAGPAIARRRDLYGINVATAARVAAEARGGEILITEEVRSRLGDARPVGRTRRVSLRGLSGTTRVITVPWAAAAA